MITLNKRKIFDIIYKHYFKSKEWVTTYEEVNLGGTGSDTENRILLNS
jgi:hypothetical protein